MADKQANRWRTCGSDEAVRWQIDEVSFKVAPSGPYRRIRDYHVNGHQVKNQRKVDEKSNLNV